MTDVIDADADDVDVLSAVIGVAFHDLPPSPWLIADEASRWRIFPGYFRLFVEHALAAGTVHTTPRRNAVALWIPADSGPPASPDDYVERLAAITEPWTARFLQFDAALDAATQPGYRTITWQCWRSGPTGKGEASAPRCSDTTTSCSTEPESPPTSKPPAPAIEPSTYDRAMPTTDRPHRCIRSRPAPVRSADRLASRTPRSVQARSPPWRSQAAVNECNRSEHRAPVGRCR